MITSQGLIQLGFKSGDFVLQDDGNGTYIRDWNSSSPRPIVADIEAAHNQWEIHRESEVVAKKERLASVKSKLEALGLTTEEVKEAFGI